MACPSLIPLAPVEKTIPTDHVGRDMARRGASRAERLSPGAMGGFVGCGVSACKCSHPLTPDACPRAGTLCCLRGGGQATHPTWSLPARIQADVGPGGNRCPNQSPARSRRPAMASRRVSATSRPNSVVPRIITRVERRGMPNCRTRSPRLCSSQSTRIIGMAA